jgi:circadian clock protein KaiC
MRLDALSTGVKNLDIILKGGIPRYSINILGGPPGSGKTILAQQIVFNNIKPGHKILYLVTVSEPTMKMMRYQQMFSFFNKEAVHNDEMIYLDFSDFVLSGGLKGIMRFINHTLNEYQPHIIVIDSFKAISNIAHDDLELRNFSYELAITLSVTECTSFLVGEYSKQDVIDTPVFAIADGIVMLERQQVGLQDIRYINISKMRGTDYLMGSHPFVITENGITVFPRTALTERAFKYIIGPERISSGIEGVDDMMSGGILKNSSTLVVGSPGCGKTLFSLHFIMEGLQKGESSLYVTTQETPEHLITSALSYGWNIEQFQKDGKLRIIYVTPVEMIIEQLASYVKEILSTMDVKRVVIDSLMDLEKAASEREHFKDYAYALINYFRSNDISVMATSEMPALFGASSKLSVHGISFICDNVILLQYVELNSAIVRALTILKMRGSNHSNEVRQYQITDKGFEVLTPFTGYEGIHTGAPCRISEPGEFYREPLPVRQREVIDVLKKKGQMSFKQLADESELTSEDLEQIIKNLLALGHIIKYDKNGEELYKNVVF